MTDESGEFARIARLAKRYGPPPREVMVGIGDDAAVLASPAGEELVWTVDAQVDEVHFRRAWVGWRDIGWRAFMAAASDLAAMGARPLCALSALALPADFDDAAFDELAEGAALAAAAVGAPIVGGNMTRAREVVITTTLLGSARRAVRRKGAREGDRILACGALGLARAGLLAKKEGREDTRLLAAIAAWERPVARVREGISMGSHARAAIDISDGLAADLAHLAEASGVAVVIDAAALVEHGGGPLADAAAALGVGALELALEGGEDYALVIASAAAPADGFTPIGEVRAGRGVWLRSSTGERPLSPRGFDHFVTKI